MNFTKRIAKVFHSKRADNKEIKEKRMAEEQEQKIIQQKMALLNGEEAKQESPLL